MVLCKLTALSEKLLKQLQKSKVISVKTFAAEQEVSAELINEAIDILVYEGHYNIHQNKGDSIFLDTDISINRDYPNAPIKIRKNKVRIGLLAHTALNSVKSQPHIVDYVHALMQQEGVDLALHAGSLTDGHWKHNIVPRSQYDRKKELFIHDPDTVIEHIIKHYPNPPHVKKYFIPGTEDMSWVKYEQRHVVREICEKRKDMIFAGDDEAIFKFGDHRGLKLRLILRHLSSTGFGVSQVRSYRSQKAFTSRNWEFIPDILVHAQDQRFQSFPLGESTIHQPGTLSMQSNYYIDKAIMSNPLFEILDVDVIQYRNYCIEREQCQDLIEHSSPEVHRFFNDLNPDYPYLMIRPDIPREEITLSLGETFQKLIQQKQNLTSEDIQAIQYIFSRIKLFTNIMLAHKAKTVEIYNLKELTAPYMYTYWDLKDTLPEFKKIAQLIRTKTST